MTNTEIERRACEHLERFEVERRTSPVAPDGGPYRLLEEIVAWMKLKVVDDPMLPGKAIGQFQAAYRRINVRPGLPAGRRIFTIAHEIGHAVLHTEDHSQVYTDDEEDLDDELGESSQGVAVFRGYDSRSRVEREANLFAASLLAPLGEVRARVLADPDWNVDALATYFGLSRAAMESRLSSAFLSSEVEEARPRIGTSNEDLDDLQLRAVRVQAPALVVAGPGAGKTRVLVQRFLHLVEQGSAPSRILALTFANKAAGEMAERLSDALPVDQRDFTVATFHSFGLEILKLYGHHVGIEGPVRPLTPASAFALTKAHLGDLPMGSLEVLTRPASSLPDLIATIARAKDELIEPDEFQAAAAARYAALSARSEHDEDESELTEALRTLDCGRFYAAYQELLRSESAVDFGDLVALTVRLLETPVIGDEIRGLYDHILVDEVQDINRACGRLLHLLNGGGGKLWAVGDPRQGIYRFRGAFSGNLLDFAQSYPDAEIVHLQRNYRSVPDLVRCSQLFDFPRREDGAQFEVHPLEPTRESIGSSPAIRVVEAPNDASEIAEIVAEIGRIREEVGLANIAVLCRSNLLAQTVSDALVSNAIPTRWGGALHSRASFKEAVGAIYVACDDLRGLFRLSQTSDFRLTPTDLRTLTNWARGRTRSLAHLLHEAAEGGVEELSPSAVKTCEALRKVTNRLRSLTRADRVLGEYMFELSPSLRRVIASDTPESKRVQATLGETYRLAKGFAEQATEPTPGAFLNYLHACIEAGELKDVGSVGEADAVTILTIHKSKGLEWPVVFVPSVALDKMPNTRKHRVSIALPQELIRGTDPRDEDIEKACLFYVAATRARDRLVMSYALKYGNRKSGPSPYLDQIRPRLRILEMEEFVHAPACATSGISTAEGGPGFSFEGDVPYSALRTFRSCPKQFEFRYVLNIPEDGSGYLDFRSVVFKAQQRVLEAAQGGATPNEEETRKIVEDEWAEQSSQTQWYAQRYKNAALTALQSLVARIRSGSSITFREPFSISTGGRTVAIVVDEVERGEEMHLRWHKHGRPAKSHIDTEDLPALMLAAASQSGVTNAKAFVTYPVGKGDVPASHTEKVVGNRTRKMHELIQAAESGPYPPKPDPVKCGICSYSLICPSRADEEGD